MSANVRPRVLYSFPELKSHEIIQCLADLKMIIAESELMKPTPSIVQKVYECFAELLMNFSKHSTSLLDFEFEFQDIYTDAFSLVSFQKTMYS